MVAERLVSQRGTIEAFGQPDSMYDRWQYVWYTLHPMVVGYLIDVGDTSTRMRCHQFSAERNIRLRRYQIGPEYARVTISNTYVCPFMYWNTQSTGRFELLPWITMTRPFSAKEGHSSLLQGVLNRPCSIPSAIIPPTIHEVVHWAEPNGSFPQ